jgi:hypothetical protein
MHRERISSNKDRIFTTSLPGIVPVLLTALMKDKGYSQGMVFGEE